VWWTKYKELTHLPAAPTLPLQEINIASLINKVNGKKVASTRGKKEKVSNAKKNTQLGKKKKANERNTDSVHAILQWFLLAKLKSSQI
jgi:hypothetical protein